MTAQLTHIAISAINPLLMRTFYKGVFGLRPASPTSDWFLTDGYVQFANNQRAPGWQDGVYHLTDGVVILQIMPWVITDYAEAGIVERPALDHVGFSVESLAAYQSDLDAFVEEHPEAGPWVDVRTEEHLKSERGARAE